ncbi:tetratricopeptide repeat protein 31 isoform X2 [Dendrobates tinctorius]|uniref:tetratricopeptide repeat protein 31 isoform X2 n=1 Tax=Dendrobates tinctorius TaxID=92724 RepID=UPI003CC97EB6
MEEDSDDSYPDEYYYYNDDDEDDEDCGFWDGTSASGTYCGFRPSFLYPQDYNLHTRNYITREQADKNAEELLEEEKKEKEKADKKRLKKKRQKDRKRQQKLKEEEQPAGENLAPVDATRAALATDSAQDDIGELGNEDSLDLGSSFVRQAQKKMENKPKPERKERNKEVLRERVRDKSQDSVQENMDLRVEKAKTSPPAAQGNGRAVDLCTVQQSVDLASIGNNLASMGRYMEALHYYTEAIRLNPGDYRFLGNRSYSYERVGRCQEALQDAERSLELHPHFIKGYFRKGKALKGLKRYSEAITAFQQVLSCDLSRAEAAQEIAECHQKLQEMAMAARKTTLSNTPLGLMPTPLSSAGENNSNKVFIPRNLVYTRSSKGLSAPKPVAQNLPAAKPVPACSALYPVWVGNITSRITEDVLRSQFAVFGAIHSLRILYSRTCAFINFSSKHAAEAAFRSLQGLNIEGTTFVLQLRNPEHKNLNLEGSAAK